MTKRLLTLLWTALTLAVPTLPSLAAAPDQIIMLTGHAASPAVDRSAIHH